MTETAQPAGHTSNTPAPVLAHAALRFVGPDETAPRIHVDTPDAAAQYVGDYVQRDVSILNGRRLDPKARLDIQGFELRDHVSTMTDYENDDQVKSVYYPEIRALVAQATGAAEVFIFDHTVRKNDNRTGRKPAQHVHVDYTEQSAPRRVRDFFDAETAERLMKGRFLQVNVWRATNGPVLRSPLAVADARTLGADALVRTAIHNERRSKGAVGEIYGLRHAPDQNWYSFPRMTSEEVLLLKGYESRTDGTARFAPHSAFEDPETPAAAPPRVSIEVRTFAFFGT